MCLILNIETSGPSCGVALARNGELVAYHVDSQNFEHASVLTTLIKNTIDEAGFQLSDLSAIAIDGGPGSYTGLRIGSATAKGLVTALDIPFIALSSLQIMAQSMKRQFPEAELFFPSIDARRQEIYFGIYDADLEEKQAPKALDLATETFNWQEFSKKLAVSGTGAEKLLPFLNEPIYTKDQVLYPTAKDMIGLSFSHFQAKKQIDPAYFEPFYLKPVYIR